LSVARRGDRGETGKRWV
jgi:hypothetical protein